MPRENAQFVARAPSSLVEEFGLLARRNDHAFAAELRIAMRAHLKREGRALTARPTQTSKSGSRDVTTV